MTVELRLTFFFFLWTVGSSCNSGSATKDDNERVFIGSDYSDIKSTKAKSIFVLGMEAVKTRNYQRALKYFIKSNDIEPNNAVILNSIANAESSLGINDEAYSHFEKAIQADSSYLMAYASYGTCLGEQERYSDAIHVLKTGLSKSTKSQFDHYVLCFNLAVYYYKIDDCNNAKRFVKIALENGFKDDRFNSETRKINEVIQENCP